MDIMSVFFHYQLIHPAPTICEQVLCNNLKPKRNLFKDPLFEESMETITISKKEYENLKAAAQVDEALFKKFRKSLKDIKEGRIHEWKD